MSWRIIRLNQCRLTYANINHPEYEDFAVDGVVLLPLET